MRFDKKVLLVLGTNTGAVEMVKYARENGAYVIVADYYPEEKSPAKRVADLGILVSTTDIAALEKIVEEYHVDGVTAGIGELNILNALALSERCNLPFYFTRDQWNLIQDKNRFRLLCKENGVPCPKTFFSGDNLTEDIIKAIEYPAIMKPTDSSMSRGVHIIKNEAELREHMEDSFDNSKSGNIIIEQFVEGEEFTAHYTIVDGKAALVCVDNRYPVKLHEGDVTTIPVARIYPCYYIDAYLEQVNPYAINMCENSGIKDGIIFIQGIYSRAKNSFSVFEAGLRSAGEAPYRFLKYVNGQNMMNILVDSVLQSKGGYDQTCEDTHMNGKVCGIVSFVARTGVVGRIEGLEETVSKLDSIKEWENRYSVGSTVPDTDTLRQLMIRFVMVCDSREQMIRDVKYINEHVFVYDSEGRDMVYKFAAEI